MRDLLQLSSLMMCMGLFACQAYSQQHDHAPGAEMSDHMAGDLEEIRNTRDPAERKRMMQHHFQMMQGQIQDLRDSLAELSRGGMMGKGGGMEHGGGGGMGGMDHGTGGGQGMEHGGGGDGMSHHARMMDHQARLIDMLDHMLGMQEMTLEMVGD